LFFLFVFQGIHSNQKGDTSNRDRGGVNWLSNQIDSVCVKRREP
jgi:hypothetical protein